MAALLTLAVIGAAVMLSGVAANAGAAPNSVTVYVTNAGSNSVTPIAVATNSASSDSRWLHPSGGRNHP
jgi:hypothetical protein